METDLEVPWKKFSLSEKKKSEVFIDKAWVEETTNARKNCLIGRILTKRIINLEAMKFVFYKI